MFATFRLNLSPGIRNDPERSSPAAPDRAANMIRPEARTVTRLAVLFHFMSSFPLAALLRKTFVGAILTVPPDSGKL